MQQNFEKTIDFQLLFPKVINWEHWRKCKPDEPFADKVILFLNALSGSLLKDKESRLFPDIVTFAFFCRKANLLTLRNQYLDNTEIRLGRGVVFHVAPSNVPINFGYSLVAGMLSGNSNIVRVSTKEYPQVNLIIKHIYEVAQNEDQRSVADKIALVRYDRHSSATEYFSSICNVRVIWGGDETIGHIRNNSIPARSFDVTFADRYSLAAIQADEFEKLDNNQVRDLAEGFYNDTYLFDQNACSAPHLVIWFGHVKNIYNSQKRFWEALDIVVKRKYVFQEVLAVDKLIAFYRQAMAMPIKCEETVDNKLIRVSLTELSSLIDDYRCAGGYFSEYIASSLKEVVPIIKNKYQTLAYYGFDQKELQHFVVDNHLIGLDRIVPVGKTTAFSLTWDGYNLITTLSRVCQIID
ncbi:MAG: acyl-CoA reductase [Odoribacter sp.]